MYIKKKKEKKVAELYKFALRLSYIRVCRLRFQSYLPTYIIIAQLVGVPTPGSRSQVNMTHFHIFNNNNNNDNDDNKSHCVRTG